MPTKEAPTRFHHEIPRGETLAQTLDRAPAGQAVSVYREAVWEVLCRYKADAYRVREYFVVEHPAPYGSRRPVRVTEPVATEQEAVAWVKLSAQIFRMLFCQMPTWPWE